MFAVTGPGQLHALMERCACPLALDALDGLTSKVGVPQALDGGIEGQGARWVAVTTAWSWLPSEVT